MAHYRAVGEVPPKRHTQFRRPDGGLYYEELVGEEGFSSDSSLLYHRELPSAIVDARPWELPDLSTTANEPLLPRHLKLHELVAGEDWKQLDPVTGRRLVLGNADVRISYVVAGQTSPLYRNAIGDECVYVESGSAVVETVFGTLDARQGDYVLLPRATTHRWLPDPAAGPLRAYCIEANSHIAPPKRYLSRYGQLLEHAPY
jgi:homogentisate 1,2-dioxygenase